MEMCIRQVKHASLNSCPQIFCLLWLSSKVAVLLTASVFSHININQHKQKRKKRDRKQLNFLLFSGEMPSLL